MKTPEWVNSLDELSAAHVPTEDELRRYSPRETADSFLQYERECR